MARLVRIHVGGRWVKTTSPHRCSRCKKPAEVTWRYYTDDKPTVATQAICEPCVKAIRKERGQ